MKGKANENGEESAGFKAICEHGGVYYLQRWGRGVQGEWQRGPKSHLSHGRGQGWRGKGGAEAADGHEVNSHFTPWQ